MQVKHGDNILPAKTILVVDDDEQVGEGLKIFLAQSRYEVLHSPSPRAALALFESLRPDLVLLDMQMPEMSGIELCRRIRERLAGDYLPILLMTGADLDGGAEKSRALDAGADDFLFKPFRQAELTARIQSLLRTKSFYDSMKQQARELEALNGLLSLQVKDQSGQLERLNRLRMFFSPSVRDLILSERGGDLLRSHRRAVTVLFADLRGFTAFSENTEPEEVMGVLNELYDVVGRCVHARGGTLAGLAGDGIMAFFNDPLENPLHTDCAVRTALEVREHLAVRREAWRRSGYGLDFGMGIAEGYATIGAIGFEEFWTYSAIGQAANMAARLCAEAKGGQILVSQRVAAKLGGAFELAELPELTLKGIQKAVVNFNVVRAV